MPYKSPKPKPKVIVRTVDELLVLLERYRGGRIEKDKHPIHRKVVALERLLRVKVSDTQSQRRVRVSRGGQLQKLPQPLCNTWFAMLWASRNGKKLEPGRFFDPTILLDFKECALGWRDVFVELLEKFRLMVVTGEYGELWKEYYDIRRVFPSPWWEKS